MLRLLLLLCVAVAVVLLLSCVAVVAAVVVLLLLGSVERQQNKQWTLVKAREYSTRTSKDLEHSYTRTVPRTSVDSRKDSERLAKLRQVSQRQVMTGGDQQKKKTHRKTPLGNERCILHNNQNFKNC